MSRAFLGCCAAAVIALGAAGAAQADEIWRTVIVDDDGDVGQYAKLVMNPLGYPAIAYYDRTNGDLKFAEHNGAFWEITVIDEAGDVGKWCDLALLPSGEPAISYFDQTYYDLKYAWREGGQWQTQVVDSAGGGWSVGKFNSLVILPSGQPAICYRDKFALKYAWFENGFWFSEIVAENAGVTSMALLLSGHPAIAFLDPTAMDLMYAWFDGDAWQVELVDDDLGGDWPSLAVAPSGTPGIVYRVYEGTVTRLVRYAVRGGGQWTTTYVEGGLSGSFSSLLYTPGGTAVVSRGGDDELHIQRRTGTTWTTQSVALPGSGHADWTSIALRPSGAPGVSFYEDALQVLVYAFQVLPGDVNCDSLIDAEDIDPFVLALTNPTVYANAWPNCDLLTADINGDGLVNNEDIDPFVALLTR